MKQSCSRRSALRTMGVGAIAATTGCMSLAYRLTGPAVGMTGFAFNPERIVLDTGETLTWVNNSIGSHTVTAYEERIPDDAEYFSSGGFESESRAREDGYGSRHNIEEDGYFRHTFETPGYYDYYCRPHEETMVGTVVVKKPNGELPAQPEIVTPDTDHTISMGPWSFAPESLTIQPGESVGWVNGTGIAHSVTANRVPPDAEYFASGGFESRKRAEYDWDTERKGDITRDAPYTHTFETPGRYDYYCILHDRTMTGRIIVEPETQVQ
ncbi:cupredoxin domain-containing protein [Haloprofundus marisrubri]|uniref:cupredoxin domain-containing protein n=1 Tax=Haloprofundus marisrubri TaxID=1514971 RepID=UPI0009E521C1|nr:plastocyanin/azurin family copper-binding protein [Haloprofundus marisrubri]